MPVYLLDKEKLVFPPCDMAREDGLLAIGGDLSTKRLLLAYTNGIFPWYNEDSPILWWCPRERFVILPEEIKISKSMKKFMRKTSLTVTFNADFAQVIHNCRKMREFNEGTWITDDMEAAYNRLHSEGYAQSCEVWNGSDLVGGLYGVSIGRCFFGESMFSKAENASKLALISLAKRLLELDFEFIDCQFHTDHLESMGGRYMSYDEYMERIRKGTGVNAF